MKSLLLKIKDNIWESVDDSVRIQFIHTNINHYNIEKRISCWEVIFSNIRYEILRRISPYHETNQGDE